MNGKDGGMEVEGHRAPPHPHSADSQRRGRDKNKNDSCSLSCSVPFHLSSRGEGEESSPILLPNASSDSIKTGGLSIGIASDYRDYRERKEEEEKEEEEKRRLSNAFPRATYSLDLNVTYHFTI